MKRFHRSYTLNGIFFFCKLYLHIILTLCGWNKNAYDSVNTMLKIYWFKGCDTLKFVYKLGTIILSCLKSKLPEIIASV